VTHWNLEEGIILSTDRTENRMSAGAEISTDVGLYQSINHLFVSDQWSISKNIEIIKRRNKSNKSIRPIYVMK